MALRKMRQDESAVDAITVEHPDDEESVKLEPEFVLEVEGVEVLTQIVAVREDPVGLITPLSNELD